VEGHYEPTEKDDEMVISNVALYAAETWMLIQTDRRRLEAFEMWIWRRMERSAGWTNEEFLSPEESKC